MTDERRDERRDEGSILPMVLVLLIVGALVVLPLMDYTIAVFKSNHVVSNRTAESEAAKAGLRVALADPKNVFLTCDNGGTLTPANNPPINGISVQTTCTEISEVGPAVALGFQVPTGAVAMQLGADVPASFSGTTASSGPAFPYPASPDWWASPAMPDPGAQYSTDAEDDKIWMPDLPLIPPTTRSSTPFDMPAAYDCKVFFPGRYSAPVDLSGRVYFTSGVYYFEEAVTVTSDADVVVGYGLEDFSPASDCADDLQVASNVLNPPSTFYISGGGATFVFGANGHLVVDNAAMGSGANIRFNQRYDTADRGGRISIMTVNGDDAASADHVVDYVNRIPRSLMLNGTYEVPIDGTGYVPSSSTYTDKARLPEAPDNFGADPLQLGGTASDRGVMVLSWDEVTGQAAGGTFVGEQDTGGNWTQLPYEVRYRVQPGGSWVNNACPADQQIIAPKPIATDGNTVSCVISGLTIDQLYRFQVRTVNEVGISPWNTSNTTPASGSPVVGPSLPPDNVTVVAGAGNDVAQISWDTPADTGGLPISSYDVTAYSIELVPHANVAPEAAPIGSEHVDVEMPIPLVGLDRTVTGHVRAFDPNGDDLTLTIDTALLPAGMTAVVDDVEDTITVTATNAIPLMLLPASFPIPYTVTDPLGEFATGEMRVDLVAIGTLAPHPVEADVFRLLADVGVPVTARVPVADPDGLPLAAVPVTVDTSGLDTDWTVVVNDLDVTITTTAPDGTYSIPYTVTDASGSTAASMIDVTIARNVQAAGSCSVTADPGVPMANVCEIGLPDLPPGTPTTGYVGYRFDVAAINAAGPSVPAVNADPLPLGFDGGGVGLLPTPPRVVEPWIPEPIIDIRANGGAPVSIAVAGYVAVPMGRLLVENPNSFDIKVNGGISAGTFDVADARATGAAGSVPIGFKNDIVLQRKVRIVSVARNVTSTAIVEVNEDGAGYAVNTWVVG
jgi:hypothetical protein